MHVYDIDVLDPEGQSVMLSVAGLPDGAIFDPAQRRISWVVPVDRYPPGTNLIYSDPTIPVSVTATDAQGAVTTQVYRVMISRSERLRPQITGLDRHGFVSGIFGQSLVQLADSPVARQDFYYELEGEPEGMSISFGILNWQPKASDVGSHTFIIIATNGTLNGADYFEATVNVIATNSPPVVAVEDRVLYPLVAGQPFELDLQVSDADGDALIATDADADALEYALYDWPGGMTIDVATGLISWLPTQFQLGDQLVRVGVSDGSAVVVQQFTISVDPAPNELPQITSTPTSTAIIGQDYAYQLQASDANGDTLSYSLLSGPTGMSVDSTTGLVQWEAAGTVGEPVDVQLSVSDGTDSSSQFYTLTLETDTGSNGVQVSITAPSLSSIVTKPESLIGSITGDALASWTVYLQRNGSTDQRPIASGTQTIIDAPITTIDPTLQLNGQYTVLVVATSTSGAQVVEGTSVIFDGDLKVGNFSVSFDDLSIPMVGIPIQVTRTYDTRRKHEALDFGYGWSVDYQNVTLEESRAPGLGWELVERPTGPNGILTAYCVEPIGTPTVTVTLPDGQVERFNISATPQCTVGPPILDVQLAFTPESGTTSTLSAGTTIWRLNTSNDILSDIGDFEDGIPVDPRYYELTSKAGYVYKLDRGLITIRVKMPI